MNDIRINEINNTLYIAKNIEVRGNVYSVCLVQGESNYVSIRKETNNPFKGLGTSFKNFDEAIKHYKIPEMKFYLSLLENEFKQISKHTKL